MSKKKKKNQPTKKTNTYSGLLSLHNTGDYNGALFLSSLPDPLAEELSWLTGKEVSVRFWITDVKCSKQEANSVFIESLFGVADAKLYSHYSELTGYLWTDEELNVGGHDLIAILKSFVGKWLILELEYEEF